MPTVFRHLRLAARWAPRALMLVALGSCVARSEGDFQRQTADDAGGLLPNLDAGTSDVRFDLPDAAPHSVLSVDPPHGPFSGGGLATIRGTGFSSLARVWIGGWEVPAADVFAVDPTRIQITVPPGEPGAQPVVVQNASDTSTRSELAFGYSYDAFYAEPKSGPTSGGTRIRLLGKGTNWTATASVLVDLKPCTELSVLGPEELECSVPASTAGSKPIRVTTEDDVSVDVLDAFVYGDSDNGFRGGLSGGTLGSQLRVLVLDDFSGLAIPGASVIVGSSLASAVVETTDAKGVAVIQADGLAPQSTVTIASKCYQPVSFVDVPVDTVTAYLSPVLSVDCIDEGDPPPVGGSPAYGATIRGELVWDGGREFEKATWTNVPAPSSPGEAEAAYLFRFGTDPTREFALPAEASRVTPESAGEQGYGFSVTSSAGNLSFYALAGIENRTLNPPTFVAYAMGVVRGVSAEPAETVSGVYIPMTIPLDHALTLELGGPTPTAKGPDRVRASVAVRVGSEGYALLPAGVRTELLPLQATVPVVGVPPLAGDLLGAAYVAGARAFTGASDTTPRSVLGLKGQTSSAVPIALSDFVQVPRLVSPQGNDSWDGAELEFDWHPGGPAVDLMVVEITGSSGLVEWTIAVPGGQKRVQLPSLSSLSDLGLKPGPITIAVSLANIEDFDYGSLRYRQLGTAGWNAHSTDVFDLHLAAP